MTTIHIVAIAGFATTLLGLATIAVCELLDIRP
jgi:hypothetical protein